MKWTFDILLLAGVILSMDLHLHIEQVKVPSRHYVHLRTNSYRFVGEYK